MATYIARRLIQGVIVLLAVSLICFIIFRSGGDPAISMAGQFATFQEIEEVRRVFGLDKPYYIQYFHFIANAVQGNFGKSFVNKVAVLPLILERLPATVELATSAIFIAFVLGVGLGVLVSLKPYALRNRFIMAGSLVNISMPTFLTGILLIMVFAVYLKVLPPFGRGETVTIGFWRTGFLTWSGITHLILPAFTLGMYQLAVLLRLTRAGMREVLTEEYIKTAWAKGLSPMKVIFKHYSCLRICSLDGNGVFYCFSTAYPAAYHPFRLSGAHTLNHNHFIETFYKRRVRFTSFFNLHLGQDI